MSEIAGVEAAAGDDGCVGNDAGTARRPVVILEPDPTIAATASLTRLTIDEVFAGGSRSPRGETVIMLCAAGGTMTAVALGATGGGAIAAGSRHSGISGRAR